MTSKLGGYYLEEQYQKKGATGKSSGVSFAELAATKAAEKGTAAGMSFKDMWLAEESALRRKLMEQEADERYQTSISGGEL